jgi:hypothetical protein
MALLSTDKLDPTVVVHLGQILRQSSSFSQAVPVIDRLLSQFSDPFPYAMAVLYHLANVPTLEKYAESYRNQRHYLVTDDEILQSYHKEFPTWMRPS